MVEPDMQREGFSYNPCSRTCRCLYLLPCGGSVTRVDQQVKRQVLASQRILDWWQQEAGTKQVYAEQRRYRMCGRTSQVGKRRSDADIDDRQKMFRRQARFGNSISSHGEIKAELTRQARVRIMDSKHSQSKPVKHRNQITIIGTGIQGTSCKICLQIFLCMCTFVYLTGWALGDSCLCMRISVHP